jgi:secreted trypsin-like serine protease
MKLVHLCRTTAPLLLLLSLNAHAITNGQADGKKHPAVGALVDYDSRHTAYAFCTGTLISPTVMLTAAHCNPGVAQVKVTFESAVQNAAVMYVGRYSAHPEYRASQSDPHDIAVIVFDQAIPAITPAKLPTLGLFDTLKANGLLNGSRYTAVGYGGQERSFDGQGQPIIKYEDRREWAVSAFNSLNPAWLRLSQNEAVGNAGTCYGDSGGPNFIGSSNVVGGVTSYAKSDICRGTGGVFRMDRSWSLEWVGSFLT